MKNIIPKDSRYIPFTQQKLCCVPACISMIMYRHKIQLISQELLGYHLGLIVPKEELKLFWNGRTGSKPSAGYGTRINEHRFHPNKIFPKLKIPLKMIFHPIDGFLNVQEFKKYLVSIERNDKDVAVCFNWSALYGQNYSGGHLSIIDKVNLRKGEVRLIDPEYKAPKWRIVKLEKLKKAMEVHGEDKSGGFWEFLKI